MAALQQQLKAAQVALDQQAADSKAAASQTETAADRRLLKVLAERDDFEASLQQRQKELAECQAESCARQQSLADSSEELAGQRSEYRELQALHFLQTKQVEALEACNAQRTIQCDELEAANQELLASREVFRQTLLEHCWADRRQLHACLLEKHTLTDALAIGKTCLDTLTSQYFAVEAKYHQQAQQTRRVEQISAKKSLSLQNANTATAALQANLAECKAELEQLQTTQQAQTEQVLSLQNLTVQKDALYQEACTASDALRLDLGNAQAELKGLKARYSQRSEQVLFLQGLNAKKNALEKDACIASKALQTALTSCKAEVQELKKGRDAAQEVLQSGPQVCPMPMLIAWHALVMLRRTVQDS